MNPLHPSRLSASHRRRAIGMLAAVAIAAGGCAAKPTLPTYPRMPVGESLDVVRGRAQQLERVTGTGTITLDNADRGSVQLDAAFVLAPPDRARVRAWKFTQAVFDLTLNADGLFVFIPRERGQPGDLMNASKGAAGAIRQWLGFFAGRLETEGADVRDDSRTITIRRPAEDGMTLTTTIDRPTLVITSQRLADAQGVERFTMTFGDYRPFGETLWPTRIVARSERGTITIRTDQLQPNVAAEAAFTPPRRAVEVK